MSLFDSIYGALVRAKNALHERGTLQAQRLKGPVISVGNLAVGGSGKTPFVILLGELLKDRGVDFDVLSRGYGRTTTGVLLVDPNGTPAEFGDEPLLIAGVATEALEMLEDEPGLDAIFVPVGGGSGAAGVCITAKAISPGVRVIGVQSEAAPAAYESWSQKRLIEAPNKTIAEGLATGSAFALPQTILREQLKEFELVSDEEIMRAMVWMIERAHTLAEAAGAFARH
jgi:hypothetical protein